MSNFIFGTLSEEKLRLLHYQAQRRGVQHGRMLNPLDPAPGDPVAVEAITDESIDATHCAVYYTTDGSTPEGDRLHVHCGSLVLMERVETVWDIFSWSFCTRWRAVLPPQPSGTTVRYRIGAWREGDPQRFADDPNSQRTIEQAANAFWNHKPLPTDYPGDPRGQVFAYQVDRLTTPAWAWEAVIYHIFVDRFSPGGGRGWLQTDDLNGFCGGTLAGVEERLDYIAALGANCIWLSPFWVAPSHHGYDVTDYFNVDPRLGGNAAMHSLVRKAHDRGIRVLFDLVCNHISNEHPIFLEAKHDPASPYREWFIFNDSKHGYVTYFDVASMPKVNLVNPGARKWMIDLALHWLVDYGADGYRLDHAQGPDATFWGDFRAACRAARPDCLLFGEVIEPPDFVRTFQGRLDGCLDFITAQAIRQNHAHGQDSAQHIRAITEAQARYFDPDFVRPVFFDNHDMDRFLYLAGGDKRALLRAAEVLFSLPQPPIIYYGTEVGLSQRRSVSGSGSGLHECRTPMLWGEAQDTALLGAFREMIQQRRSAPPAR